MTHEISISRMSHLSVFEGTIGIEDIGEGENVEIETIRIEFAKYGKSTMISTRAYVENRIGADTYYAAAKAGLQQFKSKEDHEQHKHHLADR